MPNNNEPVEETTTTPTPVPDDTKTFSQEQLDKIVEERLARQRKQYADYEELKCKASKFDELEEANKSELQKVQDLNATLKAQLDEQTHANLVNTACMKYGIPAEYADFVTGSDEEAINASAAKLAQLTESSKKHS